MDWDFFREEVRQANDIVRVVEEAGVTLKKAGKLLQGFCPFHQDKKTPSFTVYPESQSFYCFGCNRGGDVFSFIEQTRNCGFVEAQRELAHRAGITPPSWTPAQEQEQKRKRVNEDILTATVQFYFKKLPQEVKDYLMKKRGLTGNTIVLNKIGYAPTSELPKSRTSELLNFLKKQGYTKSQAIKAGILYENGREYFSGCIIFPNWHYGKVVYITGRGWPEKSHKKPLKDKLPLKHLFLEQALREKEVVIAEGETDTYTLGQAGFNTCGILGTGGFKDEWTRKFGRVETVYISLDGDKAGREATLKLAELLKSKARIVLFPEFAKPDGEKVKDWNELFTVKYGGDIQSFQNDYQELLDQAQTTLEFKIRQIPQDIPKREIPRVLSPIITQLVGLSEIEQEFYIDIIVDHFKGTLKISHQAIRRDIKQAQRGTPKTDNESIEVLDDKYPRVSPALDFVDGVGYVSIPLNVKLTTFAKGIPVTKIAKVPFLITSTKEISRVDELELLEKKGLILNSQPLFLDKNRWSLDHIKQFREDGFKADPFLMFQEVKVIYDSYLDFKEPYTSEVLTLWTIGTYIYPVFESYPYIALTGEKESGKTKTLNVAEKLCFNAVYSSDMSPSLLFRIVEGSSCTILIDEAERLRDPKLSQDFRLLLNAGYKRGGRAHRSKPETFDPQSFEVYSPKMIANIKGLEEVLEARCIQFTMLRTKDIGKANKVVTESSEDWSHTRHLLYTCGLTFFQEIRESYLSDIETKKIRAISGREGELWHPLLAIAKFLDKKGCDGLFERIKEVAVKKGKEAKSVGIDDWTNAMLLGLRDLTLINEMDIYNKDIKEKMTGYLGDGDSAPSHHWIGRALKRFGLVEESERAKRGYRYVIKHETVEDVIERYGV